MSGETTTERRARAQAVPRARTFQDLRDGGMSRRAIRSAVRDGALIRARRDVYLPGDASVEVQQAACIGGRVDCISALRERGVFVRSHDRLHVQVRAHGGRLAAPGDRKRRLRAHPRVVAHWRDDGADAGAMLTDAVTSLAQAVRCQRPRDAVATLDSAIQLGVIRETQLDAVFALLPLRFQALHALVDGRAESGPESLARLALRVLGTSIELQVRIAGVGRVDLLVAGWIVVECDSREYHSDWKAQVDDRRRDLRLAERGYACVRVTASQIFDDPGVLVRAVQGLLATGARTYGR